MEEVENSKLRSVFYVHFLGLNTSDFVCFSLWAIYLNIPKSRIHPFLRTGSIGDNFLRALAKVSFQT